MADNEDPECLSACQEEREIIAQQLADCLASGGPTPPPDCSECESALASAITANEQLSEQSRQLQLQVDALTAETDALHGVISVKDAAIVELQSQLDECLSNGACDGMRDQRDKARSIAGEWRTKNLLSLVISDEMILAFNAMANAAAGTRDGAVLKRQQQQQIYYGSSGPNFPWEPSNV